MPCFKTLTCWHSCFSVAEYLRRELTDQEWCDAFEKPMKPKILSLAELIDQARKRS